jgi:hypothetical protein
MRGAHVVRRDRWKVTGKCGWWKMCTLRWDRSEVKWCEVVMWGWMRGRSSRWGGTICLGRGEW